MELTKESVYVLFRVKHNQIVNLFTDACIANRQAQFLRYCHGNSTFAVPSSLVSTIPVTPATFKN